MTFVVLLNISVWKFSEFLFSKISRFQFFGVFFHVLFLLSMILISMSFFIVLFRFRCVFDVDVVFYLFFYFDVFLI